MSSFYLLHASVVSLSLPLNYFFNMRRIIGFLLISLVSTSILAQKKDYKAAVIAFYNLENLYDTVDNTMTNDEEFLPDGVRNGCGRS